MQVNQSYEVRRIASINAKTEPVRSPKPLRCIACQGRAVFFLCDESGKHLLRGAGGYCARCAPSQEAEEIIPSTGTPAPLELIEAASTESARSQAHRATQARLQMQPQPPFQQPPFQLQLQARLIETFLFERETLGRDLARFEAEETDGRYSGADFSEEIEITKTRLKELNALLLNEENAPWIVGFDDRI